MNARDEAILRFLSEPLDSPRIDAALSDLARSGAKLEEAVAPDFETLARRRILASNSLFHDAVERGRWDEANAYVEAAIQNEKAFSLEGLKDLAGLLVGSPGVLRDKAIYGCQDEYLTTESFQPAIALLAERVNALAHPILKAAYVYIWTINVHPFANGNGRTARLAADWILMSEGILPLCFPSNVQGHVAYGQAERFPSLELCVLKCCAAVDNSYKIALRL